MAHYAIDKSVTANELRFHYRDWDGHGWPTLLLHGLAGTSHVWDLVAPLLEEDARTIALDLHGHGRSDKPDIDYRFETLDGDLIEIIDALHLEHPVLVGHDWGANLALWLAVSHPDRFGGVILVDGAIIDYGRCVSWEEMQKRHAPPNPGGRTADDFREEIIRSAPQGLISPAVEAAIMASYEIDTDNHLHRRLPIEYHHRILRALWEQRLSELYPRLTCPVLMLPAHWEGHDQPGIIQYQEKGAEAAQELMPDVEVIELDKTIADLPLQRPHQLAEEIRRFLKERL